MCLPWGESRPTYFKKGRRGPFVRVTVSRPDSLVRGQPSGFPYPFRRRSFGSVENLNWCFDGESESLVYCL